jgi:lipoprotein
MNKIAPILYSIALMMLVMLSACNQSSENPLVGKWEHNDVSGEGDYAINSTLVFTFNSDGTGVADFKASGNYIRSTSKQLRLTYSESNDTLVIKYTESGQTMKNIIRKLDNEELLVVGLGVDSQQLDFKRVE